MNYLLIFIAYLYISTGVIIGIKLSSELKYRWAIPLYILIMAFIWLPNLPADIIVKNMKGSE